MKNKYFLLLFASIFLLSIQAQNNFQPREIYAADAERVMTGAEHMWLKQENIIPTFIKFRDGGCLTEEQFLFHVKKQFKLQSNYSFQSIGTETDQLGYTHKRYQVLVDGVPVENGIFVLHIKAGKVEKYNGYIFNAISIATTPSLSEDAALRYATSSIGASVYKWNLPEEEAFIKREQNNPAATFFPKGQLVIQQKGGLNSSSEFILCWKFDIYAHKPMGRYDVYVNAQTGEIVKSGNKICTVDAAGTATTVYRGVRSLTTDNTGSSYRLREAARGSGIRTYNMRTGTTYGSAVDFTDTDNNWNNVNPAKDQYAPDAHWGAEKTYDFYLSKGRNSIDGSGYLLNLYMHYDVDYDNAYWDGTRMTFGDGGSYFSFRPLVSLDITAHEVSHGLDQYTANLDYLNESGALNESFSDIFGTAVEYYADPSYNNWTMGEDLRTGGIRSMASQNPYGNPDTYFGTNWYTGSADNGGVHTNSGVQNFWYYLLAAGGTGTNDIGNAYTVTGQGRTKATDISWRNMVVYLTNTADYADARFYAIQSA
jgi:Zn-dependent metalloprotease